MRLMTAAMASADLLVVQDVADRDQPVGEGEGVQPLDHLVEAVEEQQQELRGRAATEPETSQMQRRSSACRWSCVFQTMSNGTPPWPMLLRMVRADVELALLGAAALAAVAGGQALGHAPHQRLHGARSRARLDGGQLLLGQQLFAQLPAGLGGVELRAAARR